MPSPTQTEIQAWQSVVGVNPSGTPDAALHIATINWFRQHGYIGPRAIGDVDAVRKRVVDAARGQIGERNPDTYWGVVCPALMGNPHGVAWCGGFALWCLRQAGLCDWNWIIGKGFTYRMPSSTAPPEPGDIAYFAKLQHHAVVEECHSGRVYTIDGNSMAYPREGVVARSYPIVDVTAFYSIRHLVAAVAAAESLDAPHKTPPSR